MANAIEKPNWRPRITLPKWEYRPGQTADDNERVYITQRKYFMDLPDKTVFHSANKPRRRPNKIQKYQQKKEEHWDGRTFTFSRSNPALHKTYREFFDCPRVIHPDYTSTPRWWFDKKGKKHWLVSKAQTRGWQPPPRQDLLRYKNVPLHVVKQQAVEDHKRNYQRSHFPMRAGKSRRGSTTVIQGRISQEEKEIEDSYEDWDDDYNEEDDDDDDDGDDDNRPLRITQAWAGEIDGGDGDDDDDDDHDGEDDEDDSYDDEFEDDPDGDKGSEGGWSREEDKREENEDDEDDSSAWGEAATPPVQPQKDPCTTTAPSSSPVPRSASRGAGGGAAGRKSVARVSKLDLSQVSSQLVPSRRPPQSAPSSDQRTMTTHTGRSSRRSSRARARTARSAGWVRSTGATSPSRMAQKHAPPANIHPRVPGQTVETAVTADGRPVTAATTRALLGKQLSPKKIRKMRTTQKQELSELAVCHRDILNWPRPHPLHYVPPPPTSTPRKFRTRAASAGATGRKRYTSRTPRPPSLRQPAHTARRVGRRPRTSGSSGAQTARGRSASPASPAPPGARGKQGGRRKQGVRRKKTKRLTLRQRRALEWKREEEWRLTVREAGWAGNVTLSAPYTEFFNTNEHWHQRR